ncbi:hypothetical protein BB561_001469 [Smittium simulii]|uniref:Purine nucleoside phosphorylase n=1 Tax=Smittium simulii TaxID=133385 RepID=A0A2T9YUH5_9FUNG|nr:hypothetical protein BB561_001469 [Smittium simulii]
MTDPASSKVCADAATYIKSKLAAGFAPKIGVFCGTNMQPIADLIIEERIDVPFSEIPGFVYNPDSKKLFGKFVFGILEDSPVALLFGACKYYEGHSLRQITMPIRVMKLLGVSIVIMTNASASINPEFKVGDICVVTDHISFPSISGLNPLIGPNYSTMGPRILSMSDAYSFKLSKLAFDIWLRSPELTKRKVQLKECTYFYSVGPSFETRAECRAARILGGDVLGCSTVPEVQVARHCNIEVLCLTLVTTTAYSYDKVSPKDAAIAAFNGQSTNSLENHNIIENIHLDNSTKATLSRPADISTLVKLIVSAL